MSIPTVVREEAGDASSAGATSWQLTLLNSVPIGNTLILLVLIPTAQTITSSANIVDSQGNTWAQETTGNNVSGGRAYIYSCRVTVALGNGDTVTITPSASVAFHVSSLLQVSGRVGAVFSANGTSGSGLTASTTSTTPGNVADTLQIGLNAWPGATSVMTGAGASQSQDSLRGTASASMYVAHKTQAAASPMTASAISATLSPSQQYTAAQVFLRGQTRRYVDYTKADNTLSGLSWANAKKDIASSGALAGDLVNIAKSADPAAMTGTLAFVDNSASVSTTSDLSATAVAKTMVGAATDGSKGWWEVSAVTSTTITLVVAYAGTTETVTGYKLGTNDAGSPAAATTDIAASPVAGTATDHVTITGGYNTGNDTRDGYTHYWVSGATKNGRINQSLAFEDWSYIGVWRSANGFTCSVANTTTDHCQVGAQGSNGFNGFGTSNCSLTNSVSTGVGTTGASFNGASTNQVITNLTILKPGGTGLLGVTSTSFSYLVTSLTINRAALNGITAGGVGRFVNCTVKNSGTTGATSTVVGFMQWANCTFGSGNSSSDLSGGQVGANVFYSCLFNSSTVIGTSSSGPDQIFDRYQQTQGSYRRVVSASGIVLTNTANARSGTCMELQFANAAPAPGSQDSFLEQVFPIPAQQSVQRSVSVYVAKSSGWNGDSGASPPTAFGLSAGQLRVGLRWNGDWVGGSPDVTPPTTSYVQRNLSYTPSEDGTLELVVQAGGTSGSIYVDDATWS